MSVEVMKQALEALEISYAYLPVKTGVERDVDQAITALRQAIEFDELVEKGTKAWADTPDNWVDDLRGDGAEKTVPSQQPGKWVYPDCAPPEPEPVAWIVDGEIQVRLDMAGKLYYSETNVYSAPPKRDGWSKDEPKPVAWIKEQELAYMSAAAGIGETQWKTNLGLEPEPGDVGLYLAPVHAIDMSQERADETAKDRHD